MLLLLQPLFLTGEGPAQTLNYMVAGYVVIFGVMALYLASLVIRTRNAKQDLETLQELGAGQDV